MKHNRTILETNPSVFSLRFAGPILLENILTMTIGMVFSLIISGISPSALAATGMANSTLNVINAFFSMIYTGSAVLISRQIGAREYEDAALSIGQSFLLALLSSLVIMALFLVIATPFLRLLMPNAEDQLFGEALGYFRLLMLSLPFLVLQGTLAGIYRSMGNGKLPMVGSLITNLVQISFGWLFMSVLHLEEIGAGLAYLVCRLVGSAFLLVMLLNEHHYFRMKLKDFLTLKLQVFLHVVKIGLPSCFESIICQLGYLIANSMVISLGTFEAGVYQILNTINSFMTLPQPVCSTIAISVTGQLLGAKKIASARKNGFRLWVAGIGATVVISLVVLLPGTFFPSLYSSDPATIQKATSLLWVLLVMDIFGVSINAIDPQLRAGGDLTYTMLETVLGVWVLRLPFTYLFCMVWNLGSLGIFLANTISLIGRASAGLIRWRGSKWIRNKV